MMWFPFDTLVLKIPLLACVIDSHAVCGVNPGVFLGGTNILSSQIPSSSSAFVNSPIRRDHSLTLIVCSILKRRKEIESASGSVVALKRNVEKNSLAASTWTSWSLCFSNHSKPISLMWPRNSSSDSICFRESGSYRLPDLASFPTALQSL